MRRGTGRRTKEMDDLDTGDELADGRLLKVRQEVGRDSRLLGIWQNVSGDGQLLKVCQGVGKGG